MTKHIKLDKVFFLYFIIICNSSAIRWMNWRLTPDVIMTLETSASWPFTEPWLGDADSCKDLHISDFECFEHMDRSPVISNTSAGRGVCFYVNESYIKSVNMDSWLGAVSISLRPVYLAKRVSPALFHRGLHSRSFFSLAGAHFGKQRGVTTKQGKWLSRICWV